VAGRRVAVRLADFMRKLSSLTFVLGTLAIAGCGGGADEAASPLDEALGYLPANAPLVVAVDTDVEGRQFKAIGDALDTLPAGRAIEKQVKDALEKRAGNLNRLESALGNEFVVGSADAKSFLEESDGGSKESGGKSKKGGDSFVGAIQAAEEGALERLMEREKAEEDGEKNGATLYRDSSGGSFAIKDDVLIVAGSKQVLEQALETRESEGRMTEDDFERGAEGLPKGALVRVYADVGQLLRASPSAGDALDVKWVKALRTLRLALSFDEEKVLIDFRARTDPSGLTEADLPFASGAAAPQVFDRPGEISLALRDPAHVLAFAQVTAGVIDPTGFGSFESAKATVERRLGLSIAKDVLGQLEGDLTVSIKPGGKFGARAEVEDPAEFERTLETLAQVLPDLARGATGKGVGFVRPKAGEDFYALATADGESIVFGVVNGVFVLSNDPDTAGSLASEETKAVPGASGALVVSSDASQLIRGLRGQARKRLKDQLEGQPDLGAQLGSAKTLSALDELIGSAEISTRGLSGSFELTLEP
jgi:hypothetical protein